MLDRADGIIGKKNQWSVKNILFREDSCAACKARLQMDLIAVSQNNALFYRNQRGADKVQSHRNADTHHLQACMWWTVHLLPFGAEFSHRVTPRLHHLAVTGKRQSASMLMRCFCQYTGTSYAQLLPDNCTSKMAFHCWNICCVALLDMSRNDAMNIYLETLLALSNRRSAI